MIEAVFFDMDGTLVDTEPYWLASEIELMSNFGYSWSAEDQRHCLGGPLPRVGEYMHSLVDAETPEYFVNTLVSKVEEKFSQGIDFMPGAHELLHALHMADMPLGLVSASPRNLVDATLNALPSKYFQVSISSNDVVNSKPDPESYIRAAKSLDVNLSRCVILEDSMTGIAAARASRAFVIAIPHIVDIKPDPQTIVIDSLVDFHLEELFEKFNEWMTS